jgi:hypothetical protein
MATTLWICRSMWRSHSPILKVDKKKIYFEEQESPFKNVAKSGNVEVLETTEVLDPFPLWVPRNHCSFGLTTWRSAKSSWDQCSLEQALTLKHKFKINRIKVIVSRRNQVTKSIWDNQYSTVTPRVNEIKLFYVFWISSFFQWTILKKLIEMSEFSISITDLSRSRLDDID